jgi:hypothetical protein
MTKEEDFKQRFIAVLSDLQQQGSQDGEAMALIGTLGAEIASKLNQPTWTAAKAALDSAGYAELLSAFQKQGNALHQGGETKKAYAIQALTVSLLAASQRQDAQVLAGERLLDSLIDRSVALVFQAGRSRN